MVLPASSLPLGATWRPVLTGADASAAISVALDIAETLRADPGVALSVPGLARGAAGLSILHSNLARTGLARGSEAHADSLASRARSLLITTPSNISLFNGLTGVAFAYSYAVVNSEAYERTEAVSRATDAVLDRLLDRATWRGHFDLITGLQGLFVFSSSRVTYGESGSTAERIAQILIDCAEEAEDGIAWRTRPEELSANVRELHPTGYFDLGLAHGAPGAMVVLSQCAARGMYRDRAISLVTRTKAWLDRQILPESSRPRVRNFVSPGNPDRAMARIAWCHGDLSVAAAYIISGLLLSRPAWVSEGVALASGIEDCPESADGISDACFCHGTAGVAHVLNRLGQLSGSSDLHRLAAMWFSRLLRMRTPGAAVGGYPMRWGSTDAYSLQAEPGLLLGAAGVALALIAAATPVRPDWDQIFLLSWPGLHLTGSGASD